MARATVPLFACAVAIQFPQPDAPGGGSCKQQQQAVQQQRFLSQEPMKETIATAKRALAMRLHRDSEHGHGHAQLSYEKIKVLLPAAQHAAVARGSAHTGEADEATKRWGERLGIKAYDQYRRLGLVMCTNYFSASVSAQALTAASNLNSLAFLVDDMCFDAEDLACYHDERAGAGVVSRAHPERVHDFLTRSWIGPLGSLEPPPPRPDVYSPVEMAAWETGRDLRRLSASADPAWYRVFLESVRDNTDACVAMRAHPEAWLHDLDAYAESRFSTAGAGFVINLLEMSRDCFLAPHVRVHPRLMNLVWAAGLHACFVNDVFSYSRDRLAGFPDSEYNIVSLLMRSDGLTLDRALRRAVEVTNSYADAFRLAEEELPPELESDPAVRSYVLGLKELVSGNLHLLLASCYALRKSLARCISSEEGYIRRSRGFCYRYICGICHCHG